MVVEQKKGDQKINRREFLNVAWLASLGFLFVDVAGVTYLFSMPRFKVGEFGDYSILDGLQNFQRLELRQKVIQKLKYGCPIQKMD